MDSDVLRKEEVEGDQVEMVKMQQLVDARKELDEVDEEKPHGGANVDKSKVTPYTVPSNGEHDELQEPISPMTIRSEKIRAIGQQSSLKAGGSSDSIDAKSNVADTNWFDIGLLKMQSLVGLDQQDSHVFPSDSYAHASKGEINKDPPSWYIIHPESTGKIFWDLFVAIFIFYSVISVPYFIGFKVDNPPQPWATVDLITDVIFWTDMVVSSVTMYENQKKQMVHDHVKILQQYGKVCFFFLHCECA